MSGDPLLAELGGLVSERRNPRTADIDLLPTADMLALISHEDAEAVAAVRAVIPEIARAVDRIAAAFRAGGRLVYMGAGTSGRLGVLDASECPPTFGVPNTMVVGLIAGGEAALRNPVEHAEDDPELGVAALDGIGVEARDVVVGVTVSGRTPYVLGGLQRARAAGAATVALTCNPGSAVAAIADIAISPVVGPEALAGSTRMKSGTAQKLVLNMLSTGAMIRIGKTYGNLMVDMRPTNRKLAARAARMVAEVTGCSPDEARNALALTANDVKLAILIVLTGLEPDAARRALAAAGGFLRKAVAALNHEDRA